MKVLYIAKRGPHDMGTKTHFDAIKEIYGEDNIIQIDLLSKQKSEKKNYISFAYEPKDVRERITRILEGNSPFISNKIIRSLCEIVKRESIQLVFTEESDLGNLYATIKRAFPAVKIICFFHDISADLFAIRIKDAPKWKLHYIQECKLIIKQENVAQQAVDERWVFNKAEIARFKKYYGSEPEAVIPIGSYAPVTDYKYKTVSTGENEKKTILFVCSSYYVNINGFMWFYTYVVPKLTGNYRIVVVGSGTQQLEERVDCDKYNIEITGMVDSMTPFYEQADIVIAPVFDGGGMKVKTVEALSFGKVFVSTSESLNGYWEAVPDGVRDKLIFRCNTADEWVQILNGLLNTKIKRYNKEIIDVFEQNFSYTAQLEKFKEKLLDPLTLRVEKLL